jgi:hypothetical protein
LGAVEDGLGFEKRYEERFGMSGHSREPWLERNWSWVVILFGVIFVALIDTFAPTL